MGCILLILHCFDLLLICFLYDESKKWRLSHSRRAVNTESEPETDQCLNGRAPPYLSEHCIPVSSADTRQHLRSANRHLLAVPRFRLNAYGRRAFHVAGPMAWNSPGFFSGIQRAAQTVLDVYLKRTCSRDTSASSAIGLLNDYALYKSTHSLPHSLFVRKKRKRHACVR